MFKLPVFFYSERYCDYSGMDTSFSFVELLCTQLLECYCVGSFEARKTFYTFDIGAAMCQWLLATLIAAGACCYTRTVTMNAVEMSIWPLCISANTSFEQLLFGKQAKFHYLWAKKKHYSGSFSSSSHTKHSLGSWCNAREMCTLSFAIAHVCTLFFCMRTFCHFEDNSDLIKSISMHMTDLESTTTNQI